jgi:type IX secretion system PorP/SprF family membrane protein
LDYNLTKLRTNISTLIRFLIITLSCCVYYSISAQDPLFSQYFAAPLQINPAFAGNSMGTAINTNYRNQWPGLDQAYVTYAASVDHYVDELKSGFGLYVSADDAGRGILRTNRFTALYSYQVRLGKDFYTRIGVEAGAINTALDWNKLVFLDQIDPEFGLISPGGIMIPSAERVPESLNRTVFDASVGILAYSSNFYGGISIKHINSPGMGFYRNPNNPLPAVLPVRLVIHGGTEFVIQRAPGRNGKPEQYFSPSILFARQGRFSQLMLGSMYTHQQVFGGLWMRHTFTNGDALVFHLGGRYEQFRLGYSYDFTISRLYGVSGGSHEISFSVLLNNQRNKIDYSDCFQLYR